MSLLRRSERKTTHVFWRITRLDWSEATRTMKDKLPADRSNKHVRMFRSIEYLPLSKGVGCKEERRMFTFAYWFHLIINNTRVYTDRYALKAIAIFSESNAVAGCWSSASTRVSWYIAGSGRFRSLQLQWIFLWRTNLSFCSQSPSSTGEWNRRWRDSRQSLLLDRSDQSQFRGTSRKYQTTLWPLRHPSINDWRH